MVVPRVRASRWHREVCGRGRLQVCAGEVATPPSDEAEEPTHSRKDREPRLVDMSVQGPLGPCTITREEYYRIIEQRDSLQEREVD